MQMNKKVMAVAVAGALGAPGLVLAQTSTVQIGGGIHLIFGSASFGNPSANKRTDWIGTSEPEIFVRGEEGVGGGNAFWFQCTSSFDVLGTAAVASTAGASSGAAQWCGRNSAIGFKGNWGNFFAGNWDVANKLIYNNVRGWWG